MVNTSYQVTLETEVVPMLHLANNTDVIMTSTLSPVTSSYRPIWSPEVVFRVTTIVVVMVFTFLGNSALILGIICHRNLRRKRVNIFLVNLAIGDLMVCLITMTTEIFFVAFGEWVLGAAACKIFVYGQIVTLASTTFLLTAMSIDRYQVIVQPFKSLTGQPKISRKVLIAWVLAFVFAVPHLFIFVQTENKDDHGRVQYGCESKGYTGQWQRKLYFTLMTVYYLIVPTCIMTFCYVNIIRVVWMRTASAPTRPPKLRFVSSIGKNRSVSRSTGGDPSTSGTSRHTSRSGSEVVNNLNIPPRLISSSKRNVVKMTLSVIICFVLCWTPYFVVSLVRIYSDYRIKLKQALSVAEIMALVHSALNPIVYGMFSTQVAKRAIVDLWARCKRKEIVATMDFIISDDDSYWTDERVRHFSITRVSDANQPPRSRVRLCCMKVWAMLCCKKSRRKRPAKPVLVYRKSPMNPHTTGNAPHYESFRMRAQTTAAEVAHFREVAFRGAVSLGGEQTGGRSSYHLSIPVNIPAKSVSDSNIHNLRHDDHVLELRHHYGRSRDAQLQRAGRKQDVD